MGQYIEKRNIIIRWLLIAANFITLVLCLSVVSVGVWTIGFKSFISGLLTDRLFLSCAYLQVIAGLLCIANSIFGFYSSYKEVKSLVLVYTAVSVLLLSVLVMGGVIAYVFRHQIETNMKAGLMSDLRRYNPGQPGDSSPITLSWDRTQARLECCGMKTIQVESAWQIWKYNSAVNPGVVAAQGVRVPPSCCKPGLPCGPENIPDNIWTEDCYVKGMQFLQEHSLIMGSVTLTAAITMVFGILLSVLLFKKIR